MIRSRLTTAARTCIRSFSSTQTARLDNVLPRSTSPIVAKPHFFNSVTGDGSTIPTYRVLDGSGKVLDGAEVPEIDEAFAVKMYENMLLLPTLDTVLYNVQRQGKISFYVRVHSARIRSELTSECSQMTSVRVSYIPRSGTLF